MPIQVTPRGSASTLLIKQFGGYFSVAVVGLAVDFAILVLCAEIFRFHYLVSAGLGFAAGLVVTFLLSERFVFNDPTISQPLIRFGTFAMIGLAGMGILGYLMWLQVSTFAVPYLLAKVLATGVVFVWNFAARRALYRS
jgi:putative flippase GtrA